MRPSFIPTVSALKFGLLFFILSCLTSNSYGQELNDNRRYHGIDLLDAPRADSVVELTIPQDPREDYIMLDLRGGAGGDAATAGGCRASGGEGARVKAIIRIGEGPGEIPAGSSVRLIVGDGAKFSGCDGVPIASCSIASGGGGGSALLINLNGTWEIIAVAGGGGGAYAQETFGSCVGIQRGQGGRSTESGGDGGGDRGGNGGIDGGGGSGGSRANGGASSGGGGGALGDGGSNVASLKGKKGYADGGYGGTNDSPLNTGYGGWGFGGGGARFHGYSEGGGGGGGYSGGGGGSDNENGGGGGSYVNPMYTFNTEKIQGRLGNPEDNAGFVAYQFTCIPDFTGFEYIQELCKPDDLGRIQLIHDIESNDRCLDFLEWDMEPVNGWSHLGNGLFRSMRAGTYTV
ncbi:MAG: hypothetical protein AAF840_16670, partial [Bacteroidota bacterium]